MRLSLPRPTREQLRVWFRRALWLAPAVYFVLIVSHVLSAPGPQLMAVQGDIKFGLDEAERREIYGEIARYHDHWDRLTARVFPDHEWSRYDDFANHVRRHILMLAGRYGLHYSEVFMIYDEGVRGEWTGPDGETMPTHWVPLQPRIQ